MWWKTAHLALTAVPVKTESPNAPKFPSFDPYKLVRAAAHGQTHLIADDTTEEEPQ